MDIENIEVIKVRGVVYQNLLELKVNTLAGARRSAHKNDGLRKGLIASSPSGKTSGGKNNSTLAPLSLLG